MSAMLFEVTVERIDAVQSSSATPSSRFTAKDLSGLARTGENPSRAASTSSPR